MTPLLVLHIAAGGIAILSGALALAMRKGGRLHRRGGMVFLWAMLVMATMAGLLSVTLPDWSNLPGALFVAYLAATGWKTLRPRSTNDATFDLALLGGALVSAGIAAAFAWAALHAADGLFFGKGAPLYVIFAALSLFAAGLDIRVRLSPAALARGRIARHVWCMCTALFFATGSFFLGQQKVMPAWLQGSPVLFALALAPLVLMAFWPVRVRRPQRALAA